MAKKKSKKKRAPQFQPTRRQFMGEQFQPTRMQFVPGAAAANAVKKMADACSQKLGKLKKELNAAVKDAKRAETAAKRCKGSLKKAKSHSAPKARKASKKARKSSGGEKTVKLADLLGRGPRKHSPTKAVKASNLGKRWSCGGPVRSGCGGSGSKVLGKVR